YTYALRHASPTIVGTYAYVNPVIAVLLGWLILREPVTTRTFLAMVLIVGAVVWIQFSHRIPSLGRRPIAAAASEQGGGSPCCRTTPRGWAARGAGPAMNREASQGDATTPGWRRTSGGSRRRGARAAGRSSACSTIPAGQGRRLTTAHSSAPTWRPSC